MKIGTIVLIPFPFAELSNVKIRPAVVIAETDDKYKDLVLSAISSVVPSKISKREILLQPNKQNNLRANSIIKVDRIVTLKKEDVVGKLGKLNSNEIAQFRKVILEMVE